MESGFVAFWMLSLLYLIPAIAWQGWRARQQLGRYRTYGLAAAGVMLAGNALDAALGGVDHGARWLLRSITESLAVGLSAVVGLYCAERVGIPGFRWLGTHDRPSSRQYVAAIGGIVLGYTMLSSLLSHLADLPRDAQPHGQLSLENLWFKIWISTVFPFKEEVIYRLTIQNVVAKQFRLADKRYWIAILLTSLVFSAGHAGSTEIPWLRVAWTLPGGLALGWLFRRFGIEACVLAHGSINAVASLLRIDFS